MFRILTAVLVFIFSSILLSGCVAYVPYEPGYLASYDHDDGHRHHHHHDGRKHHKHHDYH